MAGRSGEARLGGERALGIALRTGHLFAMALVLGAAWSGAPGAASGFWRGAVGLTGLGLTAIEASHSRFWIVQVRGLGVVAHLALMGAWMAGAGPWALGAALVVGAVGSHLPRNVRKWSLVHRTVVD